MGVEPTQASEPTQAVVVTVSDRCSAGEREDAAGPAVAAVLEAHGYQVVAVEVVPDGIEPLRDAIVRWAQRPEVALLVSTGGTGFSPRDLAPEATQAACPRLCPGIGEAMRAASARITDRACLSRATAGIRERLLVVNVPGSPKAAVENLEAVIGPIAHGLKMLRGGQADCARLG